VEEGEEVIGVLAGGVEADGEVDGRVPPRDLVETVAELRVAGGGLGEGQLGGGGLEVVVEEDGVVAIAGGVEADADPSRLRRRRRLW
jgi:hypothetical protein